MTPLTDRMIRRIAAAGPMTVAEFMAESLMDPEHGYYATRDPFGTGGDFITAPEISQMFGELIGLSLAQSWMDQGAPAPFTLAELGPGRGTLMADALRATRSVPGFHAAARVHLVEASATLRDRQRETLEGYELRWRDSADALPEAPLFLVANEFFDALPIRQFQRDAHGWRERQVAVEDGRLIFGLSAPAPLAELEHRLEETAPGDIVETCAAAGPVMQALAERIAGHGGAALVIDYGGWRSLGDTLQAVRGHQPEDPLAHPGEADLTAHVDFEALARAASPLTATEMTPQGVFLERLGITQRAQALARGLDGAALDAHVAAHRRLTHPDEMGSLFKVTGFHSSTTAPPAGLQP
ncbi:SAM-dependent methyltransferase [Psychromarinibacter sp. C21-152]|uniref:SAM-dependent methyltransferase n=1 Tax=Psychromarinibacter sediminicola TaxID=3033385 RepID=A0AAE3NTU5_9RHOB|nr:SAM-dependent methyltransferase [Psychromarinibacter sediminicola]MDF0601544.1 SAM-dependent methyltransferase [Psychromarinibacter sediminicola]